MALLRVQVRIKKKSGLTVDDAVNTWHVETTGAAAEGDMVAIGSDLAAFYQAIQTYLGASIATGSVHEAKFYALSPGAPGAGDDVSGSPVYTHLFTITPGATQSPGEVAVALSMKASTTGVLEESGGIRPAARRRGRVMLGPLGTGAAELDATTKEAFVLPAFRTAVLNAAVALQTALEANTNPGGIVVYSPSDGVARPIVQFSMDNAFDTVRSRGQKATNRTVAVV